MRLQGSTQTVDEKKNDRRAEAGMWLKQERERAGLSQREIAGRLGLQVYTFISQIESGKGRLPPERYESYAAALGVPAADFAREMLAFYEPTTFDLLFNIPEAG